MKLLVVDDNIDILEILQIAFEAKGHEVLTLSDGLKVFDAFKQFSPDAILLDVFLGDINGVTVCNQLKSNPRTKHIPVVLFSAHATAETILNACPADGFVGKPFNIHRLIEIIESLNQAF